MRAIDSHVHLDFPDFGKDLDALMSTLLKNDIGVINVATTAASVTEVSALARKYSNLWGTIGIHPNDFDNQTLVNLPGQLEVWRKLLEENHKIVALGEVGLDYFRTTGDQSASIQKAAIRQMLTFAEEVDLPVILHCRDAYGDLVTLLHDYPTIKGVVHCFSGTIEQARQLLELGLHISFTAMIAYPGNDELLKVVTSIPEDRLLLETDSPYLPPQSRRGTRNDPTAVLELAELLAVIRGVSPKEILDSTIDNTLKVFKRIIS